MARPIKETPVLKGKDVERFKYNLEHPTPVSAEEVTKARETYEKFKRIQTRMLPDMPLEEDFPDMDKALYTPEEAYELTMKDIKAVYDKEYAV